MVRAVLKAQLVANLPAEEWLVSPELARAFLEAFPHVCSYAPLPLEGGQVRSLMGMRVGRPCWYCGRRKASKGKHICDGCGAPNDF